MTDREAKRPGTQSTASDPRLASAPGTQDKTRPGFAQQQSRVSKASSRYGTLSGRSTLRSQMSSGKQQPDTKWGRVKKAVKSGTLVAVGLKQTNEEKLHWNAVQKSIQAGSVQSGSPSGSYRPGLQRIHSHLSYQEIPAAHIAAYPYHRQPSSLTSVQHTTTRGGVASQSVTGRTASESGQLHSDAPPSTSLHPQLLRQRSLYGTGRAQVVRGELKPDLWKIAYKGVMRLASTSQPGKPVERSIAEEPKSAVPAAGTFRSFIDLGDDVEGVDGEEVDGEVGQQDEVDGMRRTDSTGAKYHPLGAIQEEDEDFFGTEIHHVDDNHSPLSLNSPDAAIARFPPKVAYEEPPKYEEPKPASKRRGRIGIPRIIYDPLFGGYDRGYGGLGLSTHLLRFKYRKVPHDVQRRLDAHLLHKRPYFTYWLMLVHFIIMVTALSVYGFAPYGWDQQVVRGTVFGSDLAYDTEEKIIIPNVWLGPSQQSLVLLGALYGPCMRRDRQLFEAIDEDRDSERDQSGCCVRPDESGCVQVSDSQECNVNSTLTNFVLNYNDGGDTIRGVCGTSPRVCTDPRPGLNSDIWVEDNILTWPICLDTNINTSDSNVDAHLTCDITGRPCCVSIQALCIITTREHCDFLSGRFHQEAFLCSQVDCLNTTCGLLPFREFNEPDQVYRLWIALFMHAGLIHLFLSLVFSFLILRHVEKRMGWLRTSILYIVSGIGGNLVSAFFVPYNPEVGPAGSILGVVAYMFVFLIFESRLLVRPWIEFLKLGIIVLFLLILGLFPFIDNFAHIGGFVFGFLLSGILVPYHNLGNLGIKEKKKKGKLSSSKRDVFRIVKWVMVLAGIPAVLLLFVLFFVLFYVVQDTWDGFRYVNCIPFTSTICQDLGSNIRTRSRHII